MTVYHKKSLKMLKEFIIIDFNCLTCWLYQLLKTMSLLKKITWSYGSFQGAFYVWFGNKILLFIKTENVIFHPVHDLRAYNVY